MSSLCEDPYRAALEEAEESLTSALAEIGASVELYDVLIEIAPIILKTLEKARGGEMLYIQYLEDKVNTLLEENSNLRSQI